MIKTRRLGWACHIARTKEGTSAIKIYTGSELSRCLVVTVRMSLDCVLSSGDVFMTFSLLIEYFFDVLSRHDFELMFRM